MVDPSAHPILAAGYERYRAVSWRACQRREQQYGLISPTGSRNVTQTCAVADAPETRYARLGEDRVAYQVLGDGPLDLVYAPARGDSLDLRFDWPPLGDFLRRLASFGRLIVVHCRRS